MVAWFTVLVPEVLTLAGMVVVVLAVDLTLSLAALAVAHLGYRAPPRLASLRHGASPAGSTTCVGIAGGTQMLLARMVATGKTAGRPGHRSGAAPVGARGGRGRVCTLTRCRAPTGAPNPSGAQPAADPSALGW